MALLALSLALYVAGYAKLHRRSRAGRRTRRLQAAAFGAGWLALVVALQVLHRPILGLFSQDPRVLEMAGSVLLVAIVFEPGRNLNTIIIPALKGAGDVRFPIYVGIASMWTIAFASVRRVDALVEVICAILFAAACAVPAWFSLIAYALGIACFTATGATLARRIA